MGEPATRVLYVFVAEASSVTHELDDSFGSTRVSLRGRQEMLGSLLPYEWMTMVLHLGYRAMTEETLFAPAAHTVREGQFVSRRECRKRFRITVEEIVETDDPKGVVTP